MTVERSSEEPMLRRQTLTVVAVLACSLGLAAPALAATPPVITAPSTASSLAGRPLFTWALGPAGEYLRTITVSSSNATDAEGAISEEPVGETIRQISQVTSKAVSGRYQAGTYYFQGLWHTKEGTSPAEHGYTPIGTFTIPPVLKDQAATIYSQQTTRTLLTGKVTFLTNIKRTVLTCKVMDGRTTVDTWVEVEDDTNIAVRATEYCYMDVPERLDGKQLRLVVTIRAGRLTRTAVRTFTAR